MSWQTLEIHEPPSVPLPTPPTVDHETDEETVSDTLFEDFWDDEELRDLLQEFAE